MIYKNIEFALEYLYKKAPLQRKKIKQFMALQNDEFMNEFEFFLKQYSNYLLKNNLDIKYAIDAYLKMINDMFKSQIKFMRTGKYPVVNLSEAIVDVYNDTNRMLPYMIGLALSQYLWSTHYEMFNYLKSELYNKKNNIKKYIEIGPGHGLFLKTAIDILNNDVDMTAIDISPTSLKASKSILEYFYPDKQINFINEDMLNLNLDSTCDFVVMGEVIEHVENPKLLLEKVYKLLNSNGKAFLSTCVNCPMIDHVYHFKTVDEIRNLFNECGLVIETEKILPVENLPMEDIIKQKVTINYAAIVKKGLK